MGGKGRFDTEKFYTELDLQLNLMLLETEQVEVLEKATFTVPEEKEEQPIMRFYYPSDGEELWEIGKQFGISIKTLEEKNGIKDGVMPKVLFIPYA